ncbi:hypothetical protein FH972_006358 [Carpinus fangiana]|uniref:GST C-terminal domain-containing protein n=1 Tax=Carpinus fangiana TaxID=176857 RepID=A0A5N6QS16_9ROSI|nr:hypothetical protein FH972_006358 [Carpinus fangiana]
MNRRTIGFFGRESIGMVDIVASFIGFWLGAFEKASGSEWLTRDYFPKLTNWTHRFVSNNIVKESLPPKDKLVANFRNRFEGGNYYFQMDKLH